MKTLAGSVAVGHIAQLEDELSQTRAERDNAGALCAAARAVANAAEDKADNLEAMVESLESQLVRAKATTKHWREVLTVCRNMRRRAERERDEARAQVKKLEAECNKACRSIRVMEPAYRETVDCMIANGAGWAAARKERNEARRHACRLMRERNEARADAADLKFLLGGTCEMAVAPYDPHEAASLGYEVGRGGDGD